MGSGGDCHHYCLSSHLLPGGLRIIGLPPRANSSVRASNVPFGGNVSHCNLAFLVPSPARITGERWCGEFLPTESNFFHLDRIMNDSCSTSQSFLCMHWKKRVCVWMHCTTIRAVWPHSFYAEHKTVKHFQQMLTNQNSQLILLKPLWNLANCFTCANVIFLEYIKTAVHFHLTLTLQAWQGGL